MLGWSDARSELKRDRVKVIDVASWNAMVSKCYRKYDQPTQKTSKVFGTTRDAWGPPHTFEEFIRNPAHRLMPWPSSNRQ